MDFIEWMLQRQTEKGWSDKELSEKSGIDEYTLYNLKQYRCYLSKIAYFALCSALGMPIAEDAEIENLLRVNREKVGLPQTNIYVAANGIERERVEKLEKELAAVKDMPIIVERKTQVINRLYVEIDELKKEIEKLKKDIDVQVQEAYMNGVKESASKIQSMKVANSNTMVDALNREYQDKVDRLQKALKKRDLEYSKLYKTVVENSLVTNITAFEKPMMLANEELGLSLADTIIKDVLEAYYTDQKSFETIAKEWGMDVSEIVDIVKNYEIIEKRDGVIGYVKKA